MIRIIGLVLASVLATACTTAPKTTGLPLVNTAEADRLAADAAHLLASRHPAAATTVALAAPADADPLLAALDESFRLAGFAVSSGGQDGIPVDASVSRSATGDLLLLMQVGQEVWSRLYRSGPDGVQAASMFTVRQGGE